MYYPLAMSNDNSYVQCTCTIIPKGAKFIYIFPVQKYVSTNLTVIPGITVNIYTYIKFSENTNFKICGNFVNAENYL